MRYAYGLTGALLIGGAAASLITGHPAGAQVAQNDEARIGAIVPRSGAPASFAELVAQLQPAVVNISTREKFKVASSNPFAGTPFANQFSGGGDGQPETREGGSLGSGFIVSADGYVVTNNHVITADGHGEAESITVSLPDGAEYPAKLVGRDTASDLAVLKISAGKPLPFVKFGDSAHARVGDWVLAIGQPYGLGGTVTAGIISAVTRNTGAGGAYDRYIQTDAAINQGNSGGPMFDMKGQVIGINREIISPSGGSVGIGFAIPAETAAPIVGRLIKGEPIERGYLGIRIQPLDADMADSLGLPHNRGELVQGVEPGQAAAKAGIQAGDVVVRVAGTEVSPDQSLSYIVANIAPGRSVPVDLIRNGQHLTVNATVEKRPSEEALAKSGFVRGQQGDAGDDAKDAADTAGSGLAEKTLGLKVQLLTAEIDRELGVPETTHGVVIAAVDPSSDAGAKGFSRGDIIVGAGYRAIANVAEFDTAIKAAQAAGRQAIFLQVIHNAQPARYIAVRLR